LNNNLPFSIRAVPVVQTRDGQHYSWWHWEESRVVDNLGRQDQEAMAAALADGKLSGEQFDKAIEATSLAYYQTLFEDLHQSWEECERLDRVLDEKFGREAPSLMGVKKAIEDCRVLIGDIGKKKGGLVPAAPSVVPEAKPAESTVDPLTPSPGAPMPQAPWGTPGPSVYSGPAVGMPLELQSRADALRQLEALAAYFHQTEPLSPIPYLIQRAVRWGEMPLDEWLQDVIHDENVLGQLREMLGMKDADNGTSNASG